MSSKPAPRHVLRSILAQGKRPWSAAEVARLRALVAEGRPKRDIAARLGRAPSSVEGKLYSLGLSIRRRGAALPAPARPSLPPKKGRVTRPCLCCGRPFPSAGPHNRLCESCRKREPDPLDVPARVWRP